MNFRLQAPDGTAYARDRNRISQGEHRGETDADGFLDWTGGHLAPGRRGRTVFVEHLLRFLWPRIRRWFRCRSILHGGASLVRLSLPGSLLGLRLLRDVLVRVSHGQLPIPVEDIVLPAVRLLPQPQPFLRKPEFRIRVSDWVLPLSPRVLWIRSLRALLSHVRVRALRVSAIRRRVQGSENRVRAGAALARPSRVATGILIPAVQGGSPEKRATHRGGSPGNPGNNNRHAVALGGEGQDAQRADERPGAGPSYPDTSYPRRRAEHVSERPGWFHPADRRQLSANDRRTCRPGADFWADPQGDHSTRPTGPTHNRGSSSYSGGAAHGRRSADGHRASSCCLDVS